METTLPDGRVPDAWHATFHNGLAARWWRAVGAAAADDEAALALRLLDLPPGSRVLDVQCGDGRIALRLAAAGLEAAGVDVAPEEIALARAAARERGLAARFTVADVRCLPDLGSHDGAVLWGNALGYLPPAETAALLARLRSLLRPGGRLVLESGTVAESLLANGVGQDLEHEAGGIAMRARHAYRPAESRLETEFELRGPGGEVERRRAAHHVHTVGELVRMLAAARLRVDALLDGHGAEYRLGAGSLVLAATAV